ncbi:MAG: hypothetical protein EXR71_19515 [Myxococcales bacterium]|nr:hypothetical protein [Myxococcales bacterium]
MILFTAAALALELTVEATVAADLRRVTGSIVADTPTPVEWGRPLSALDRVVGDLEVVRGGPGWSDAGSMELATMPFSCTFRTVLPQRFGDTGALPGEGFWSNGTWLPRASTDAATWSVLLHVPVGMVVVLNGSVHTDTTEVRWSGVADRLALAVLPRERAPISRVDLGQGQVWFVGRAAQRPNVQKQVRALLVDGWPWSAPVDLVVVSDHDRRHLATAGPGVVYLSDRAFRLSPGLSRFHWPAVRRALYAAGLAERPLWDARFLATLLTEDLPAPKVEKALGWAAWNPIIDELLTDGTLPFYEDTFSEARPAPADPLLALAGRRDPRAAALQAREALTPTAIAPLIREALAGAPDAPGGPVLEALRRLGLTDVLPEAWLAGDDPGNEYAIVATRTGGLRLERRGGTTPEPVVLDIDGVRTTELVPGAPYTLDLPETARVVTVDPVAHLIDPARGDNRAPARWAAVLTGWATDISPSQGSFTAWGDVLFRRQGDTENLFLAGIQHTPKDLVSIDLGYVRYFGPLLDRRQRHHRIALMVGGSIFDPAYRDTIDGDAAVEGSMGYAWDTRAGDTFAFRGRRVGAGVSGGVRVHDGAAWSGIGATWIELIALHPRHVVATRLRAGWAGGEVEHRLLTLGGADAVRSVREDEVVGTLRAVGNLEYRWSIIRDASVPLPLAWLSEVQLAPGFDVGAVEADGAHTGGGATLGLYCILDIFGARPTLLGVVTAFPVWPDPGLVPQVYFSFDHAY